MAASKMRHADALKRNRAKCEQYRAEGRREKNKARRAAIIAARLARKKAKREAKAGASAPAPRKSGDDYVEN